MNTFRTVSRVLVVSAVAFVGNATAVCPLFDNKVCGLLGQNKATIASAFTADKAFDKNEHFKKAFMGTAGYIADNPKSDKFVERLAVDYAVRRASGVIGLDGLRDAALKQCDVLPEGMVRDNVNPVVQGAAELVTHPEVLTILVMKYIIPVLVAKASDI